MDKPLNWMNLPARDAWLKHSMDTTLTTPIKVGYYSILVTNENDEPTYKFVEDQSALRVLCLPDKEQFPLDLMEGYNVNLDPNHAGAHGKHILDWIVNHEESVFHDINGKSTEFICDFYLLNRIMKTPFARKRGWSFVAVKIKGIHHLFPTEVCNKFGSREIEGKSPNFPHIYQDTKFGQLITKGLNGQSCEGNRDSFYLVCKINVGSHSLLYSYRSDCLTDKKQLEKSIDEMEFASIRTAPRDNGQGLIDFLKLSWWIRGTLNNSSEMIVGQKDRNYYAPKIQQLLIKDLPKRQNWSPKVCVDFLDSVLTFVRKKVEKPMQPYRFYYDVTKDLVFCELSHQPIDSIIPKSYTDLILPQSTL